MYLYEPIIISGIPRSGTSMVAGCFGACGAWLGDCHGPSEANAKGQFENVALRSFTKRTLAQLGADPNCVDPLPSLAKVRLINVERFRANVIDIVESAGYSSGPWVYKDCKALPLWPIWRAAFPEARWILVMRDPTAIVSSCLNTSFMRSRSGSSDFWVSWINAHIELSMGLIDSGAWYRYVDSASVVAGDRRTLENAIRATRLNYREEAINSFVDRRHWRHSGKPCYRIGSTI